MEIATSSPIAARKDSVELEPTPIVQTQPVIAAPQIKLKKREGKYRKKIDKALARESYIRPIFAIEREPGR